MVEAIQGKLLWKGSSQLMNTAEWVVVVVVVVVVDVFVIFWVVTDVILL